MQRDIESLVYQLEDARQQLNRAIEKLAPQAEIYPTWKLKQLMDHIAGWDELMTATFRMHARGQQPEASVRQGIDGFNAESVTRRKELTLEQSRQAYVQARNEVIRSLREMPAEQLGLRFQAPWGGQCSVSGAVKIFASHELEHARQIEEALEGSEK